MLYALFDFTFRFLVVRKFISLENGAHGEQILMNLNSMVEKFHVQFKTFFKRQSTIASRWVWRLRMSRRKEHFFECHVHFSDEF